MKRLILAGALVLGAPLFAQAPTPQLKPAVKLELVETQRDLYKLALQLRQLEAQQRDLQTAIQSKANELHDRTLGALAKSDLDPKKYTVDAETFAVTELPAKPPTGKP